MNALAIGFVGSLLVLISMGYNVRPSSMTRSISFLSLPRQLKVFHRLYPTYMIGLLRYIYALSTWKFIYGGESHYDFGQYRLYYR